MSSTPIPDSQQGHAHAHVFDAGGAGASAGAGVGVSAGAGAAVSAGAAAGASPIDPNLDQPPVGWFSCCGDEKTKIHRAKVAGLILAIIVEYGLLALAGYEIYLHRDAIGNWFSNDFSHFFTRDVKHFFTDDVMNWVNNNLGGLATGGALAATVGLVALVAFGALKLKETDRFKAFMENREKSLAISIVKVAIGTLALAALIGIAYAGIHDSFGANDLISKGFEQYQGVIVGGAVGLWMVAGLIAATVHFKENKRLAHRDLPPVPVVIANGAPDGLPVAQPMGGATVNNSGSGVSAPPPIAQPIGGGAGGGLIGSGSGVGAAALMGPPAVTVVQHNSGPGAAAAAAAAESPMPPRESEPTPQPQAEPQRSSGGQ